MKLEAISLTTSLAVKSLVSFESTYSSVNFALAKVLFSAFCGRCQRKKNLKSKVLDTVDGLTKFNQVRIATDTFCAYYKPIKARYFPALYFDWLIFKYGTEVATTMKSLQIFRSSVIKYKLLQAFIISMTEWIWRRKSK